MKKISSLLIIVPAALLILSASNLAQAQQLDGQTVLRRMLNAEGSVAFIARQVTTIAKKPAITSEQVVYRAGFRGMRTEYTSPPFMKGEIMVDDGRVMSHFIPKTNVIEKRSSRLGDMQIRTAQISEKLNRGQLRIDLVGRDEIAGRTAYVIEIRPEHRPEGRIRKFWVDRENWVKLKTEDIAPNGTVESTSYYTKMSFVDSIPDAKFRLDRSGVRVKQEEGPSPMMTQKRAQQLVRFRILKPSYLPSGFKPIGAAVVPFRGGKSIVLRFSDGVNTFSLFQTPDRILPRRFLDRLEEGPLRSGRDTYSWRKGNLNLTIVGSLTKEQIKLVADSVR